MSTIYLWKRKYTDPFIKYDFVVPSRNSIDKGMNKFEGRESLPVSEQSLSQDAPLENTSSKSHIIKQQISNT